jgi:hypothetical protein
VRRLGSHTGFLEIDHRDSPGLSAADVAHMPNALPVAAGQHLERDVKQCSHCQRMVVLEPNRVRARAYCGKCDHYICDSCEAIRVKTGECVPFLKRLDQAATIAEKFVRQPDHPDARPDIVLTDAF